MKFLVTFFARTQFYKINGIAVRILLTPCGGTFSDKATNCSTKMSLISEAAIWNAVLMDWPQTINVHQSFLRNYSVNRKRLPAD